MATWASIVTFVMGFASALVLLQATVELPRGKRRQNAPMQDELAYQERQRRMRGLGISAAIVAVIGAYVAALSGQLWHRFKVPDSLQKSRAHLRQSRLHFLNVCHLLGDG